MLGLVPEALPEPEARALPAGPPTAVADGAVPAVSVAVAPATGAAAVEAMEPAVVVAVVDAAASTVKLQPLSAPALPARSFAVTETECCPGARFASATLPVLPDTVGFTAMPSTRTVTDFAETPVPDPSESLNDRLEPATAATLAPASGDAGEILGRQELTAPLCGSVAGKALRARAGSACSVENSGAEPTVDE